MDFTTNKAVASAGIAIGTAILGLLVAFGVSVTSNQRDAIITFITVALPAVLAFIGWLHHGHVQLKRSTNLATAAKIPNLATAAANQTAAKIAGRSSFTEIDPSAKSTP